MTKRKKAVLGLTIGTGTIAILCLAFVVTSTACGFKPGSHMRAGFHRQGPPAFVHEEMREFFLWRMDKGVADLDLTATQQEEYNRFKNDLVKTMEQGYQTKLEMKKRVIGELEKKDPDLMNITTDFQTRFQSMSQAIQSNIDQFNAFYASLNTDQKNKINDRLKEKYNAIKDHGPLAER